MNKVNKSVLYNSGENFDNSKIQVVSTLCAVKSFTWSPL